MTKLCFGNLEKLFLSLITCLIFGVANCQVPSDTPAYSSLFFMKIGIKLCQIKCLKNGHCRGIEYTIPTLTCQLSEMDHDRLANEEQYFVGTTDLADVRDSSCQLKTCPNMTCLETRTGKTVCVKAPNQITRELDAYHEKEWNVQDQNAKQNQAQVHTNLNTDLLDACKEGDLSRVKSVLSDPRANINAMDKDKMTPAMLAAQGGHKEVFDQLVRKGANLSLLDHSDRNILYFACKGRNLEIVKYVLTQNIVDINSRDEDGLTPVMDAAIWGDKGLFDFLVEEGANLSLLSYYEESIFYLACEGDNVGIIKYLLPQCIKFINSFVDGMTPVMSAAYDKRKEVFDLLVKEGANLLLLDDANSNILHLACVGGNVEIVKYLLTQNIVDINSRDGNDNTPAMIAAYKGNKAVFDLLVNNRADLTIVSSVGDNILHMACKGGNIDIVKYVITRHIVEGRFSEDNPC